MTHSSASIANIFINKSREDHQELTALKLQKLVYYMAGYYMAYTGKPLLKFSIEAWDYGPVVPELYLEFKDLGNKPITRLAYERSFMYGIWSSSDDPAPIPTNDKGVMEIADFVWKTYKNYTGLDKILGTMAGGCFSKTDMCDDTYYQCKTRMSIDADNIIETLANNGLAIVQVGDPSKMSPETLSYLVEMHEASDKRFRKLIKDQKYSVCRTHILKLSQKILSNHY